MAQVSGNSINGRQILFSGAQVGATVFALKVGAAVLPPAARVGYYYLFAVDESEFDRCYLIKRGAVYTPGIYERADVVPALGGSVYRMDVEWDFPVLPWRFTLI
jgi:hypothetical protein